MTTSGAMSIRTLHACYCVRVIVHIGCFKVSPMVAFMRASEDFEFSVVDERGFERDVLSFSAIPLAEVCLLDRIVVMSKLISWVTLFDPTVVVNLAAIPT